MHLHCSMAIHFILTRVHCSACHMQASCSPTEQNVEIPFLYLHTPGHIAAVHWPLWDLPGHVNNWWQPASRPYLQLNLLSLLPV
jgi:hypothetical protein